MSVRGRSLVDDLADLDEQVRAAARAHLDEQPERVIELLDDTRIHLADVLADLRREAEAAA